MDYFVAVVENQHQESLARADENIGGIKESTHMAAPTTPRKSYHVGGDRLALDYFGAAWGRRNVANQSHNHQWKNSRHFGLACLVLISIGVFVCES